ncbi:hypothetical protein ACWCOZ_34865, partial [Streptomyces sp. NPDC001840]
MATDRTPAGTVPYPLLRREGSQESRRPESSAWTRADAAPTLDESVKLYQDTEKEMVNEMP